MRTLRPAKCTLMLLRPTRSMRQVPGMRLPSACCTGCCKEGDDMVTALQAGAAWGAATVTQLRSIPVPWEEIAGPFR